ncbi:Uncharacterised protein [Klebsiella oxytoca]|nr:Uncharacterised protein [Klebsiella oxytoca]
MNTGLRQVLRYAGVPVDAAEPVRRQFGSRLILIVTVALLPLLIVDVPQWLFVLSQIIWGSGIVHLVSPWPVINQIADKLRTRGLPGRLVTGS